MTTDDERRRVAERLKKLRGLDYCKDPRYAVELASNAVGADHSNGYSWDKLLDRLADLIGPCDMSQSCRDTVACDREALRSVASGLRSLGEREVLSAGAAREIADEIMEAIGEES